MVKDSCFCAYLTFFIFYFFPHSIKSIREVFVTFTIEIYIRIFSILYACGFIIEMLCISQWSTLIEHILLFRKVKMACSRYLASSSNTKISSLLLDMYVYILPLTTLLNPITSRYWQENKIR